MQLFKKFLAILLAVVCLSSSATIISSAKTIKADRTLSICTSSGYKYNKTQMLGQTCLEKYIELPKGKTLKVYPKIKGDLYAYNRTQIRTHVRFTVWVYDIVTGKRVDNEVCKNSSYTSWKNNTGKTAHLSVQVRPYIATSAWKNSNYAEINNYIKIADYTCTYKY